MGGAAQGKDADVSGIGTGGVADSRIAGKIEVVVEATGAGLVDGTGCSGRTGRGAPGTEGAVETGWSFWRVTSSSSSLSVSP